MIYPVAMTGGATGEAGRRWVLRSEADDDNGNWDTVLVAQTETSWSAVKSEAEHRAPRAPLATIT